MSSVSSNGEVLYNSTWNTADYIRVPLATSCTYPCKYKCLYSNWESDPISYLINSSCCFSHISASSWIIMFLQDPSRFPDPFILDICILIDMCIFTFFKSFIWISTVSPPPCYLTISPPVKKKSLFLSLLLRLSASDNPVWTSENSKCSTADCKMQTHPDSSCSGLQLNSSSGYQPSSSHVSPNRCSLRQPCPQRNLCT